MGPSCRRRTRSTRKSSSRSITPSNNSQLGNSKINQDTCAVSPADSPVKSECMEICSSSACSTPKAERFRIPEIKTCPPAPKKRRTVTSCCLRRTSSVAFFASPDIELFFNFALCGIPV